MRELTHNTIGDAPCGMACGNVRRGARRCRTFRFLPEVVRLPHVLADCGRDAFRRRAGARRAVMSDSHSIVNPLRSPAFKLVLNGALVLALTVPILLVRELISDREQRAAGV